MSTHQTNWAGNYTYSAARFHYPETVEQVQELVARSKKVRVLGSRHSFNAIADSHEDMISLERFDQRITVDPERRTVTVAAGVRYGELCEQLDQQGYALHNLASLPHISVAGACATATHGSGDANGNLATAVAAMELVTADGEVVALSREQHGDNFEGAVVGLGGLGVVTKLTLDILPTFQVQQDVYERLPLAELEAHFDEVEGSAYSVSLFTDWQRDTINEVWLKRRLENGVAFDAQPTLFGATLAPTELHPIASVTPVNVTPQKGIPGPWYQRLPHFRMEFTPSTGEELQTEYFVARHHAVAALRAVSELRDVLAPVLQISEVRTIAADRLWMSPSYKQASVGIHFTWYKDWSAVKQVLPMIEEALAPFDARPHWGKLFTMPAARVQSLYERLPDFQQLLQSFDPRGVFRNAFLDRYIFGAE